MKSNFVGFLKRLVQIVYVINSLLELASQAETLKKACIVRENFKYAHVAYTKLVELVGIAVS